MKKKNKNLSPKEPKHKPGTSIDRLRSEIGELPQYGDGHGGDFMKLPDVPDDIIDQIVSDSIEKIHTRLEERAHIVKGTTISDQELGEHSGALNPIGDADTKIEVLGKLEDKYRSKSLREIYDDRK